MKAFWIAGLAVCVAAGASAQRLELLGVKMPAGYLEI